MLTQEKKIEYIKENRDAALVAVTSYLDAIYGIKEKFLNEDGTLHESLPKDEKAESFVKSIQHDATSFENIRRKLLDRDFNLSLAEISRVGLCFLFMKEQMSKQVKTLNKGIALADSLIEKLIDSSSENIDFLKE